MALGLFQEEKQGQLCPSGWAYYLVLAADYN